MSAFCCNKCEEYRNPDEAIECADGRFVCEKCAEQLEYEYDCPDVENVWALENL